MSVQDRYMIYVDDILFDKENNSWYVSYILTFYVMEK